MVNNTVKIYIYKLPTTYSFFFLWHYTRSSSVPLGPEGNSTSCLHANTPGGYGSLSAAAQVLHWEEFIPGVGGPSGLCLCFLNTDSSRTQLPV